MSDTSTSAKSLDRVRLLALWVGPALAALTAWQTQHLSAEIAWTAATTVWCAIWWIFEPVQIPVTSLLPLAIFPMVGVLTPEQVGASYGNPLVLLMMGGFMLSTAMERSGVHRRIAVGMVKAMGEGDSRRMIWGFMAASWFLSMWISNAATVLMLLPIALAALEGIEDSQIRGRLLLSLAYAASLGGIVTPIGTPPNLVFMQNFRVSFGEEPTFLDWMSWALPVSLVMLPIAACWLTRGCRRETTVKLASSHPWRREEVRTLVVFAVTALLWVTRKQPFGGWSAISLPGFSLAAANDASVAMLAVVAMCLIPNGETEGRNRGRKLLDWDTASNIQWGVLLLFGGGIAIAQAFGESGLSDTLGAHVAQLAELPLIAMIACICLIVTFLTEITSNTATTTLLLPILAAAAVAAGIDAKSIMIPATLSASFAFMLPVATPTNAIVFGGSDVTVRQMAREGLVLNLIGVVVVTARCYFI
ncbi:MAG: SLC13/DASS family transporter [Planctomycetales bacterium]|nr:SLC13/DASS family transporter [Planctomycetales bacterium]